MATKLYRFAAFLLTIVTLGCVASCSETKGEINSIAPTIELKLISTPDETQSLSFTIIPHDATGFGYACVTVEDYKANNFQMTKVEGTDAQEIKIDKLNSSTRYTIIAEAYNGTLVSERVIKTTSTNSVAPEVTINDLTSTADGVAFTLKASEGATVIRYAIYLKSEGDTHAGEDTTSPTFTEWRKWKDLTPKAEGNAVTETLTVGDYVLEAYAITKATPGDAVKQEFGIMIQDRPYVKMDTSKLTSEDATVKIVRNKLCGNYYVGLISGENYTFEKVLSIVKSNGAKHLQTADYEGSIRALDTEAVSDWAPNTEMRLWVIPCDADGKYSESLDNIALHLFTIPKRSTDGKGTVSVSENEVLYTSYKATVTPSNCVHYYVLYNSKEYFTTTFGEDETKFLEGTDAEHPGLLDQTPQTAPINITPTNLDSDIDYMVCAVGIDAEGKLGKINKTIIHTKPIAFNSSASVEIQQAVSTEHATFKYTPKDGCTGLRYLFLSETDYKTIYAASSKRVETALALNTANSNIVPLSGSALTTEQRKNMLEANTQYLLFTLPLAGDGQMGQMIETLITTPPYDTSNTITYKISGTPSFTNTSVKFKVLPTTGCAIIYARMIKTTTQSSGITSLIKDIITNGSSFMYEDDEPTPHEFSFTNLDNANNYYLYVLCRDINGKYNHPINSRLVVDMKNKTISAAN